MNRRSIVLSLVCALASPLALAGASDRDIDALLDRFHRAASKALFDEYFGLFAPDGIFIGTDASERWTVAEFKAYAKPHFDQGRGWTYTKVERHVQVSADDRHASFDELLDNADLGRCRGPPASNVRPPSSTGTERRNAPAEATVVIEK